MKPKLPLDKHIATNTKQALKIRMLVLFALIAIGLTAIFASHNMGNTRAYEKEHLNVAITITKDEIDRLTQGRPLDELEESKIGELQKQMGYLKTHLNSQLYIINQQEELLFTDIDGGPFGTEPGQQLHNLSGLSKAISQLLEDQADTALYDGENGPHLLKILPLASSDAFIVGDIPTPHWYTSLGWSLYLAISLVLTCFLLINRWVSQAIKDWRRQNLSQTIMDSLTSFPNRRGMELFLQQAFAAPSNPEHPHSLLLVSLDHFSQINIHYGTDAGDMLLKQIANRIRAWLHPADLVGRWDGDTFLILHKGLSDENAALLAEKIIFEINRINFDIAGETVRVSVSIGVHTIDDPDTQRFSLAHTEQALRKAKKKEGHHVVYSNGAA